MRLPVVALALLAVAGSCVPRTDATGEEAHVETNQTHREPASLTEAQNGFGFRLLEALTGPAPTRNVAVSPLSVAIALQMAANGAAGETRQAMERTLGLDGIGLEEANRASQALLSGLPQESLGLTLRLANAVWADDGVQFKPDFAAAVQAAYDAEVRSVDLQTPAALAEINGWVDEKTEGRIDEIVTADNLRQAGAVLVNAVYFMGAWRTPFNPRQTFAEPFHLPGGRRKKVPMMALTDRLAHFRGDGFTAVRLPYRDGQLSFLVFLPDESSSLAAFLKRLEPESWERWMGRFEERTVDLALPRFKLEYGATLNEPLISLGMGIAFGAGADFSRMYEPSDFIGVVNHKTYLDVNEEGTEGAAATAVAMLRSLPDRMVVDRPFFFAIRDDQSGALLFAGYIVDP